MPAFSRRDFLMTSAAAATLAAVPAVHAAGSDVLRVGRQELRLRSACAKPRAARGLGTTEFWRNSPGAWRCSRRGW